MFGGVQDKSQWKGAAATWTGWQSEAAVCFQAGGLTVLLCCVQAWCDWKDGAHGEWELILLHFPHGRSTQSTLTVSSSIHVLL